MLNVARERDVVIRACGFRRVKFRPEMAVRVRTSSSCSSRQAHGRKLSDHSSASSIDCLDVDFFCEKKPPKKCNAKLDSTLASIIPDLTETIDTDFRNRARFLENLFYEFGFNIKWLELFIYILNLSALMHFNAIRWLVTTIKTTQ